MRTRVGLILSTTVLLAACGAADPDEPPEQDVSLPAPAGKPVAACATDDAAALGDEYWGMHVTSPLGDGFPEEAPIGAVNLTTSQTYWNQIETAPGVYDFSRLDDVVETSEERGAQPMLVMGFTPAFHAADPTSPTARTTMPDLAAWEAWVREVAERYGDRLDYQVWPEPNIVGNWGGTPEEMAQLTAIAGRIIHETAPDAQVVAPAVAVRLEGQRAWVADFWGARPYGSAVADHVDAVALDPFPLEDGKPEDSVGLICQTRRILDRLDVALPVWTNEINYGVPSGGNADTVVHYPDEQQAAVVARTYLLHATVGMARVYWLGWDSYGGMAVEMVRDDGETPAATAFEVVHGWLAAGDPPVCRVRQGLHTCVVQGGEEALTVHWREQGSSDVRVPEGVGQVEDLTGERESVAPGDRIEVAQSPLALVHGG